MQTLFDVFFLQVVGAGVLSLDPNVRRGLRRASCSPQSSVGADRDRIINQQ